jgi:hypothetical protein
MSIECGFPGCQQEGFKREGPTTWFCKGHCRKDNLEWSDRLERLASPEEISLATRASDTSFVYEWNRLATKVLANAKAHGFDSLQHEAIGTEVPEWVIEGCRSMRRKGGANCACWAAVVCGEGKP